MTRPTGYSVTSYGDMITSEPRMPAYDAALRAVITPGCHVIDIGAGTGIFSLLACKYGAGHVTAIEPADEIMLLHDMSKANGFSDRIRIVQGLSTSYVPDRKADVIVSDIRGIMPLFEHHIPTIADARSRLLAPGGVLVPMRDTIRAALARAPKAAASIREPWLKNRYELDLRAGHAHAINAYRKVYLKPEDLASDAAIVAVLDYRTIVDTNMSAEITLAPSRATLADGLLLWFDAELAPGIGFSNAPGEPELVYGQSFLPFEAPLHVDASDRVEASIRATLIEGAYVWTWTTRVIRNGSSQPEFTMRQSSFKAKVMSPATLARRADSHVPASQATHAVDARILTLIDGCRSLGDIARMIRSEFSSRFADDTSALSHVVDLAERYEDTNAPPLKGAVP